MKNFKLYNYNILSKKLSLTIIGSSIIMSSLVGCGKKNNVPSDIEIDTSKYTTEDVTEIVSTEEIMTTENTEEIEITEAYDINDEITKYFNIKYNDVLNNIEDIDKEEVKEKCKDLFIELVDFIFYDSDIHGIKYSELKDGVKEQLFNDLCSLNELIDNNIPKVKESLQEKYISAKDYLVPKYYEVIEKLKIKIGDDNLDKLDEFKDNTKEKASDLFDGAKVKIKQKYEEFKKNE